jgi:hypothetical protein
MLSVIYAERPFMLSVTYKTIMLSVFMLDVVRLKFIMLSVVKLSIVAPHMNRHHLNCKFMTFEDVWKTKNALAYCPKKFYSTSPWCLQTG